jgi:hypothetical protein
MAVATRTLDFARLDERVRLAPAVSVGLLQQIVEAFLGCRRQGSAD